MSYTRATLGILGGLALSLVVVGAFIVGGGRASASSEARDVDIACGAGYRAVVRQMSAEGRVMVECVPGFGSQQASPELVGYYPGAAPMVMPLAYQPRSAAPVAYEPRAEASRVVARQPVSRARTTARRAPSWQKRALVIGTSAGVGAGVGALVGGKKGALIGAAAGGGGATVIDLIKNNK